MKIISNGVTYHVEKSGNGEPLLLLHGFTGDSSTWDQLSTDLASTYKVVTVDIIGHGKTESPDVSSRYEIEKIAIDLVAIVQKLDLKDVHVLGYSMGGRLALTMAVMFPDLVKRLILESASPGLQTAKARNERMNWDAILAKRITEDGIQWFTGYWEEIPLFLTQKKLSHPKKNAIRQQRLNNNIIGLANSLLGMGTGAQKSWWDALEKLDMPVLLITGEEDKKFCMIADEMVARLKKGVHMTCHGAGHTIHVEEPEMFVTMVREFLITT